MARLRRHIRSILLLVAAVVGVAVAAWVIVRPPEAAVDRVKRDDVVLAIAVTGRTEPRLEAELTPLAPGRLVSLTRDEGDRIREGEVLGRVEVEAASAELSRARAAREAQRARVEQALRDYERLQKLYRQEIIPRQELEQAELALEVGRRDLQAAIEAVTEARERLEQHLIVAPFDGIVLDRPVDPGEVVDPQTVVYRVGTVEKRRVEVELDERYLSWLSEGMPAVVSPIGRTTEHPATVSLVGTGVDPTAGTALVRLDFDGPPPALPAGLSVDVNIVVDRFDDALTVAREAVMDLEENPRVLIVESGELYERQVEVIDWQAERIVVQQGLEEGEEVALNPREFEPGQSVRPVFVERG